MFPSKCTTALVASVAALASVLATAADAQSPADLAGEQDAMSYDFLLAISEPEDFYPGAEPDPAATPDVGTVAMEVYAPSTTHDEEEITASTARITNLGAVEYTVAVRVAAGFAEAVVLDEIAEQYVDVIAPPIDLSMADLASGATMYRLLGDDAAAALWYARLVEQSDDPINYFFYARALSALGHDELAKEYTTRYQTERRRL